MTGKYMKKNTPADRKHRKKASGRKAGLIALLVFLGLVLIALLLIVLGPTFNDRDTNQQPQADSADFSTLPPETTERPTNPPFAPIDLGNGLVITDIGPYTGAYMEDGTNEVVSDVLMVILENTSNEALQYAELTLNYPEANAQFAVTNIPAGERVVLLEKSRMACPDELPAGQVLDNVVFIPEMPMYEDVFEVIGNEASLTVKNISKTEISGDIYVYYKNCSQDLLYGGITYRAKIEGGLLPGEEKSVTAGHYNPSASVILMVSYVP